MDDYYSNSENYAIWQKHIFPRSEVNRREKICRPNLEKLLMECSQRGFDRPSLVEIGPGFGTFALLAIESNYFSDVSVVERNPQMVAACKSKGIRVIEEALEHSTAVSSETVDIVVMFEVIEHVFNPMEFLSIVNIMLKRNGLLMLTCPNGKGFDTLMLQEASPSVDTEHVNLFNPVSIAILLERCGFECTHVETPGRLDVELVRNAVVEGQCDLGKEIFWRTLLLESFDSMGEDFQRFLVKNTLSGSMRVIARKKIDI
jgi:SAM-dependent methyltransferase